MNSFNHCALGAVGEWLYRFILGIEPAPEAQGFSRLVLRPHPGGSLSWARGAYRSARGLIASEWHKDGDRLTLRIELPPNVTASVRIPSADARTVRDGLGRSPADTADFPGASGLREAISRSGPASMNSPAWHRMRTGIRHLIAGRRKSADLKVTSGRSERAIAVQFWPARIAAPRGSAAPSGRRRPPDGRYRQADAYVGADSPAPDQKISATELEVGTSIEAVVWAVRRGMVLTHCMFKRATTLARSQRASVKPPVGIKGSQADAKRVRARNASATDDVRHRYAVNPHAGRRGDQGAGLCQERIGPSATRRVQPHARSGRSRRGKPLTRQRRRCHLRRTGQRSLVRAFVGVHPVRSVRPAGPSVQAGRVVRVVVFLVMNRSSVRFRQAAPKMQSYRCFRLCVRIAVNSVERFVERVDLHERPIPLPFPLRRVTGSHVHREGGADSVRLDLLPNARFVVLGQSGFVQATDLVQALLQSSRLVVERLVSSVVFRACLLGEPGNRPLSPAQTIREQSGRWLIQSGSACSNCCTTLAR